MNVHALKNYDPKYTRSASRQMRRLIHVAFPLCKAEVDNSIHLNDFDSALEDAGYTSCCWE